MTWYQILSLLGAGSIFSAIALGIWRRMKKVFSDTAKNMDALMKGVQAVLRAQMIRDYNYYKDKGYAPIYAKDNFENCFKQYEALGANGVMSQIYLEFMTFDTRPTETEENSK